MPEQRTFLLSPKCGHFYCRLTALGSTTFTATSGNGRLPAGARTGCAGAAAGTASAPAAGRRSASGARRRSGAASSASVLPEVPSGQRPPCRTEPAALPFRQRFRPDGQKDRGPPGVSSTRERSGWPFCFSPPKWTTDPRSDQPALTDPVALSQRQGLLPSRWPTHRQRQRGRDSKGLEAVSAFRDGEGM
jgi:hypothetical protein